MLGLVGVVWSPSSRCMSYLQHSSGLELAASVRCAMMSVEVERGKDILEASLPEFSVRQAMIVVKVSNER